MKANYHTHTYRCHHAVDTEREYVEAAIRAGLQILGFSDHSPYVFKDGHYSSFRMRPEELPEYVQTLSGLREEYKEQIQIHIGLEAEYYRENWSDYLNLLKGSGVEYLILGQHYADGEYPGAEYSGKPSDDEKRLRAYVDSVLEGVNTGLFSYVAHPDILNFTGEEAVYDSEMHRLVDGVFRAGVPFEINLLGLRERRSYPCERFWKILEPYRCPVILGADVHDPQWMYPAETIEEAKKMAEAHHLGVTEQLDITRLKKHGI